MRRFSRSMDSTFLATLITLTDESTDQVAWGAEPPPNVLVASKGLLKTVQAAEDAGASINQRQLGQEAVMAMVSNEGEHVRSLCRVVATATAAIDAIDPQHALNGLASWCDLRTSVLLCVLQLASSEAQCIDLLSRTELMGSAVDGASVPCAANTTGVASVCLQLLRAASSHTDQEGVRVAANVLRNLALPPPNREVIGALCVPAIGNALHASPLDGGAIQVLIGHVGHPEPGTAALIAACLRVLVDKCPANALRFSRRAPLATAGGPFAPLIALDIRNVRRVGR
jgi:hypothetical protein